MGSNPPAGSPTLAVIVNPAAGRGRGARLIPQVERALAGHAHCLHLTTHAGEERTLAQAAADAGAETILAVGGDGTWGNIVRGIMASGRTPRLALLAAGTGNDLAFAAALPAHDVSRAVEIALGSHERRIDVGEVDGVHFVNCAGFGFDAEVLRATRRVHWLRGHAVYLLTAARKLFGYPGFDAAVRYRAATSDAASSDGSTDRPREHHLAVIISNGARFGGGFLIAPGALVDDGMLDVVRIADGSPWRRAAVFAGALRGTHLGAPEVAHRQVRELTLEFDVPPLFDADGELHQGRSTVVTIRCHAGALRLAIAAAGR